MFPTIVDHHWPFYICPISTIEITQTSSPTTHTIAFDGALHPLGSLAGESGFTSVEPFEENVPWQDAADCFLHRGAPCIPCMDIWATVPQVDKPASLFAVASFASCLHPSLLVSVCSLLSFRCVPTGQVFEVVVWRAILQFGIFLGNCYILPHQDCPCDVLRTPRQPRSEAKMLQIYLDKKGPDRLALVTGGSCQCVEFLKNLLVDKFGQRLGPPREICAWLVYLILPLLTIWWGPYSKQSQKVFIIYPFIRLFNMISITLLVMHPQLDRIRCKSHWLRVWSPSLIAMVGSSWINF